MFIVLIKVWTLSRHNLHFTIYSLCIVWQHANTPSRVQVKLYSLKSSLRCINTACLSLSILTLLDLILLLAPFLLLVETRLQLRSNVPTRAAKMYTEQWGWKCPATLAGLLQLTHRQHLQIDCICTSVVKGGLRLAVGDVDKILYTRNFISLYQYIGT